MITLQMWYLPPPGATAPVIGDKIRTMSGEYEVLDILDRSADEFLLRMGRDQFPGVDDDCK